MDDRAPFGRLPCSLLIANRGEIAVRIARTCRELGIRSIAVFSDADRAATHVGACDEAIALSGLGPGDAYLAGARIIALAIERGVEAIHPGYGFLSENAEFARASRDAGLVFVGPHPDIIEALGDKIAAKAIADRAGVPTVPGVTDDSDEKSGDARDVRLIAAAKQLVFPVLVKAAAGGGGRGMRIVATPAELDDAIGIARREALGSFGSDRLLVERYITSPRHIEVQIFGDSRGDLIHLMERDCSIQRRHQKLIEEAPAPSIAEATRKTLLDYAVRIGREVGYDNAGTVEFVVDSKTEDAYFLEVNTRLQVEHPVTEEILGLDLVEWQIRVAAGQPLPLRQDEIVPQGCAVEARITAEDVGDGFRPQTGRIAALVSPSGPGIRVDAGFAAGSAVSPWYDSMLAKVIAHGPDREVAIRRLRQGLARMRVFGLPSNLTFLDGVLSSEAFAAGRHTTHFAETYAAALSAADAIPDITLHAAAAIALRRSRARGRGASPWSSLGAWRVGSPAVWAPRTGLVLREERGTDHRYWVAMAEDRLTLSSMDDAAGFAVTFDFYSSADTVTIEHEGRRAKFATHVEAGCGDLLTVHLVGEHRTAVLQAPVGLQGWSRRSGDAGDAEKQVRAAGPGLVVSVAVTAGDNIAEGAPLVTLESMKMLTTVTARRSGTVTRIACAPGQAVAKGDLLIELDFVEGMAT